MATFTWHEGEYYSIFTKSGFPNAIPTKEHMTIEECRELIDKRNAWAQGNAAAADVGCKPMQYAIVKYTWNRGYYPDGTFYEWNRKVSLVEIYPQDI